jgi:hypothetical protein
VGIKVQYEFFYLFVLCKLQTTESFWNASGLPMSTMSAVILSDEVARAATGQRQLRASR